MSRGGAEREMAAWAADLSDYLFDILAPNWRTLNASLETGTVYLIGRFLVCAVVATRAGVARDSPWSPAFGRRRHAARQLRYAGLPDAPAATRGIGGQMTGHARRHWGAAGENTRSRSMGCPTAIWRSRSAMASRRFAITVRRSIRGSVRAAVTNMHTAHMGHIRTAGAFQEARVRQTKIGAVEEDRRRRDGRHVRHASC